MQHKTLAGFPKRLTISFPLWLIYASKGENSPYYDIDKVMREHKERGFNCMRIDGGAGLIHDLDGNLRPPFDMGDMFGEFEKIPRQQHITGPGGKVNLLERLIETFETAKKYGIYIILSQWYYQHTYWFHKVGDPLCDELFSIPSKERLAAFGKFWHYILLELEKRDLTSQLVFVELFNEIDGRHYLCGETDWKNFHNISEEDKRYYEEETEKAMQFLRDNHPNIHFAFDVGEMKDIPQTMPNNAQVFNFHNYYLGKLYYQVIRPERTEWLKHEITIDDVKDTRKGRISTPWSWYYSVALHNDIKPECIVDIEKALHETFLERKHEYAAKRDELLYSAKKFAGDLPIICGEGVSYIFSKNVMWEEKYDEYWDFVKEGLALYKKEGVWGTVIRTCCGPEDPCWYMRADKLLELNRFFLED